MGAQRRRYETYVRLLETWLNAEQDLESWEGGVPPEPPTLTRAHSSPALGPETAPPGPPRDPRTGTSPRDPPQPALFGVLQPYSPNGVAGGPPDAALSHRGEMGVPIVTSPLHRG